PKIPQATSKRLPGRYQFPQNFPSAAQKRIASQQLREATKLDSATSRRDFSHLAALGEKGHGYDAQELLLLFRKTVDQDEATNVALIGVGGLGSAFLKSNFHRNHNTKIIVAFDSNSPLEGEKISDIDTYHPDKIEEKIKEYGVELVILTVPSRSAQEVTDRLAKTEIKGILNFTPVRISVPDHIRVQTIDLSVELQ